MESLAEYVDGLPNLCGQEPLISEAITAGRRSGPPVAGTCGPAQVDVAFPVCLSWLEIAASDSPSPAALLGNRCSGPR